MSFLFVVYFVRREFVNSINDRARESNITRKPNGAHQKQKAFLSHHSLTSREDASESERVENEENDLTDLTLSLT